jgi:cardiolipin synthase
MRAVTLSVALGVSVLAFGCSSSSTALIGPDGGTPPPGQDSGGGMGGDSGGGPGMDGSGPGTDSSHPGQDSGPPPNPLPMSTNVTIDVEPGDNAQPLLDAINAATTSVHVVMYLMDDQRWMDALNALKGAGKDVKVLLEQNPLGGSNSSAYSALQGGGVAVQWAPAGFSLTHEKCVLIDGASAWIMTMNMNATSPQNREFLATDTDAADVQEAEAVFQADFANQSYTPKGALAVAPQNARQKLLDLVATATKTIDVEGEEFSDYMLANALAAAQPAGINVRLVLSDIAPSASQQMAVTQLKGAGVKIVVTSNPYIHSKALVVDGARMYVGSANFTTGSLQYNRELGVLTANAAAVSAVASAINTDFGNGTPQ